MYSIIIILSSILIGSTQLNFNDETLVKFKFENPTIQSVQISVGKINFLNKETEYGDFLDIQIPGYHSSKKNGYPKLPQINRLIEIPQEATPRIEILNYNLTEYHISDFTKFNQIIPVQPSLSKSQTPEDVEFQLNSKIYSTDKFINNEIAKIAIKGQMRSVRVANLMIKPVDYNPVSGIIKVFSDVQLKIHFDEADIHLTEEIKQKYYSPYFENNYKQLHNYQENSLRNDLTTYPITYVIIANSIFEGHMDEFIQWKTQKGFHVEVAYTNEVGSNTTALKAFIEDLYNNPEPGVSPPSFVLMVGDAAQLPTFAGNTGSHPSDLYYCEFTGDYLPEIYYGRFSAENPNHLQSQIDKTIEYEKYEMPDPSFLGEVVMIAGVDGSYASTYGNGQINYGNEYYFNSSNNISSSTYLYPESSEGWVSQAIRNNVSNGAAFVNYTAHGYEGGWADPSFTVGDIPNLNNISKYPLMIGNCCITNQFESTTCFGEALLREPNKGAQGYIGGSNNTYWNEDYWWGVGSGSISVNPTYDLMGQGAYDGMFHSYGQDFSNWFTSNSALIVAGNLAVVEADGWSTYYWEIYHLMGDPSLTTFLGIPNINNVNYQSYVTLNESNIEFSAEPFSYVGLTKDGELVGHGLIGASGQTEIELINNLTPGEVDVVVTGQNMQPHFGTLEIGTAEGPYVILDSYNFPNTFEENPVVMGSIVNISLSLMNIGIEATDYININLSTLDEYITIIDGNESANNILPTSSIIVNGFSFEVAGNIPNEHQIEFEISIQSELNNWIDNFFLTAKAPVIELNSFITNNNSIHNPGETETYQIEISNIGNSPLNYPVVEIILFDENVQASNLYSNNAYYLDINESMNLTVDIFADSSTPAGHIVSGNLNISSLNINGFEYSLPFTFIIGVPPIENVFIEILTDSYGYETSWEIQDINGNIVSSYTDGSLDNDSIYTWDVNLEYGEYTFIIFDSYGDGICCGYGPGNYTVTVGDEIVASGGEFGLEESTIFYVGPNQSLNPPQNLNVEIADSECESLLISWEEPFENNDSGTDDSGTGSNEESEVGLPCDSCDNESCIYDCELQCVDENTINSWIGDGYCDDGTWGIYLVCEFFNLDEGDCEETIQHDQSKSMYITQSTRDLNGYNLYKNGQLLITTPTLQYSDSQIQIGSEYCYSIQASYTSGVSTIVGPNCIFAEVQFLTGDLNEDGQINVIDIVQLVNYILNINIPEPYQFQAADLNGDDNLNVIDIVQLVNMILNTNLLKSDKNLEVHIYQSKHHLKISSQSNIAGFELQFDNEIDNFNYIINGWSFYFNESKLIGINLEGTPTKELVIPINSTINILSNIVVDWNLNFQNTNIIRIPENFKFDKVYPNPFNPVTTIPFALPENANVKINIYDLAGSHVTEIINKQFDAGFHKVKWSPKNISSGIYFISLKANENIAKQKLIFLK